MFESFVPHIDLPSSARAPGVSPVRVHSRDAGAGRPIVILHGGWGFEIYPDRRIATDPSAPTANLYGGRLGELRVPTLVIHGARDPRTEAGELEAIPMALERTHGSTPTGNVRAAKEEVGADLALSGRR